MIVCFYYPWSVTTHTICIFTVFYNNKSRDLCSVPSESGGDLHWLLHRFDFETLFTIMMIISQHRLYLRKILCFLEQFQVYEKLNRRCGEFPRTPPTPGFSPVINTLVTILIRYFYLKSRVYIRVHSSCCPAHCIPLNV